MSAQAKLDTARLQIALSTVVQMLGATQGLLAGLQSNVGSLQQEVGVLDARVTALEPVGYTLEELDQFGTLEALPFSLDSVPPKST